MRKCWQTLSDGGPNVRKDAVPFPMHRQKVYPLLYHEPMRLQTSSTMLKSVAECQVAECVGMQPSLHSQSLADMKDWGSE